MRDPHEACEIALRRKLDDLRKANGRGPVLGALVDALIGEARDLGEANRVAGELTQVVAELRASVPPRPIRRAYVDRNS